MYLKRTSSLWTHSSALDSPERSFSLMILTITSMPLTPKYCPRLPLALSSLDLQLPTGQCSVEAVTLQTEHVQRPDKNSELLGSEPRTVLTATVGQQSDEEMKMTRHRARGIDQKPIA